MLTVRFPDGTAVQYNTAFFVVYGTDPDRATLYTRKGWDWVATVFGDCIVESTEACRVYNPVRQTGDMLGWLMDNMRRFNYVELGRLAELKAALKDFNAQKREWKSNE
jgi:hypothetical protein